MIIDQIFFWLIFFTTDDLYFLFAIYFVTAFRELQIKSILYFVVAVCDGCFNRLVHEASQPSPDHFRVRQLKQCATDAIRAIEQLIDSLDDPEGYSSGFNAALKDTEVKIITNVFFFRMESTQKIDNLIEFIDFRKW